MSTKRTLFLVLVAGIAVLAVGIGSQFPEAAHALPSAQSGGTIPYPGRLNNEVGQPVADGIYDFTFALYDAETDGTLLWSEAQTGVMVKGGAFVATLGSVTPFPKEALNGSNHWLAVSVRGPGEKDLTALTPRQRLSAASPASPSAGPACAHTHLGESWLGSTYDGLRVQNTYTDGNGLVGIANTGWAAYGVWGQSTGGTGVVGNSTSGPGVDGYSASGTGVVGSSTSGTGVDGHSISGTGVSGQSNTHIGVYASGAGGGHDHAALVAVSTNITNGIAAYLKSNSADFNFPTIEIDQLGNGRVVDLQNNGTGTGDGSGDFIVGFNKDVQLRFRVGGRGDFWSHDGYYTFSQDFAEMLPAADGLEPGDVLVIDLDGKLGRSTEPYQASVAGVYSTQPGIVGGQPAEGKVEGTIPLAVVGVVPVKVSAENGAIRPGDLLAASSTPGHAMKVGPNAPQGTVIGKALEKWDAGTGVIKMLATLQ
jgi:hypothetical protein